MVTTVPVNEGSKLRLDELRAKIRRETGTNVTQPELLSRLIEDAYEDRDEVVESFRSPIVPLTDVEKETMRTGRVRSENGIDEDEIDDTLYG